MKFPKSTHIVAKIKDRHKLCLKVNITIQASGDFSKIHYPGGGGGVLNKRGGGGYTRPPPPLMGSDSVYCSDLVLCCL